MASWLSSAISALAGFGSSALGISASRQAEDRAWARNLQLMKSQNDFNINMWNAANRYNSPSNQMRLLKEAGINPALFDANGGNSSASEVTAAPADVPNNSQIGQLYQSLDPSDKVISALQTDYQIQKLRTDIQYQKLLNRDFQNELNARESPYVALDDEDPEHPDWIYFDNHYTEKYTHQGEMHHYERQAARLQRSLSRDELEVYEAGMPFFKKMPEQQLRQLVTSIRTAALNNTLLSEDVKLMKEFGISPNDRDGWQSFLKAVLRNPDALGNVVDHLFGAGHSTIQRGVQRVRGYGYSHRNPRSLSW